MSPEMVGNKNKFVDRSPQILTAGKQVDDFDDSVAKCLLQGSIDDARKVLQDAAGLKPSTFTYKLPPWSTSLRPGIYTEIRPVMEPDVLTPYQTLINELKETSYDSHWNKIVGKSRDPVPGLPKGLKPLDTTFGKPVIRTTTMKDLINPPKTAYQVLAESQVGHEMYKKTHNDYNPSERRSRCYLSPAFDKTRRYGERSKYDERGIWVRCCCAGHQPVTYTNKIQAQYKNQYDSKLGQVLTPNNIAEQLPQGFTFGKPTNRPLYGLDELIKDDDCYPCLFKRDLKQWMASFNKLKLNLRCHIDDLYKKLLYYDCNQTGSIPLDIFYAVCACDKVIISKNDLEPLLKFLSVIKDNVIDYGKFLEMLDTRHPPAELPKINDIPQSNQYYLTTYQAAGCDHLIINNSKAPAAGTPSVRHDLAYPMAPYGGCKADLENLGDETYSGNLINPSVYLNYGLSFRDFFLPRPKPVIRALFEKIGYKMGDEAFEDLWKTGSDQDKTGSVCVDTFLKLVKSRFPDPRKLLVDEATC